MQTKRIQFIGEIAILAILIGLAYQADHKTGLFYPKPNFIVILTDDLDFTEMPYMPNTNKLIGEQGATLNNYFTPTPLCCPSRASTIRGQYAHNTQVLDNLPGFRGFYKQGMEAETLAVWLNKAGYNTSLVGKYLNGYPIKAGHTYIPPGWTDWHSVIFKDNSEGFYYNYTLNENGKVVQYGDAPQDYSTDVFKNIGFDFINASHKQGKPFFLYWALYAPHNPSDPAPRHANMFEGIVFPEKPSFNEPDLSDKPSSTYAAAHTGDVFDQYDANALFRKHVQTVQAIDEMVSELLDLLKKNGQLDNTYIIFTSDNGLHMGEHGLPSGKGFPYEEDIHVPFMIRGPGITPGMQIDQLTANIDIAPTLTDLAHARAADFIDGRSLVPLLLPQLDQTVNWRHGLEIEQGYLNDPSSPLVYWGVRTDTFVYIEYEDGEREYYDLVADPYQLENLASKLDTDRLTALHNWLEQLKVCKADSCRSEELTVP